MENIQVALRIRPQNNSEQESGDLEVWSVLNQQQVGIQQSKYTELVKARKIIPGQKFNYSYSFKTFHLHQTLLLDQCFGKNNTTIQLYNSMVKKIALSSLQGINGTVFMYGQTGSGKTFTMMGENAHDMQTLDEKLLINSRGRQESFKQETKGNQQNNIKSVFSSFTSLLERRSKTPNESETVNCQQLDVKKLKGLLNQHQKNNDENMRDSQQIRIENKEGVLVSALHDIFQEIETINDKKFFLKCSYLEIYTDQVYDLLGSQEKISEILTINEDQNKEFYIKNATEEIVSSIQDVLEKLHKGEQNRHYAATIMNHQSSRSHTIFRLYVKSIPQDFSEQTVMTESILNFVDLAGSEKVSMHDPMRTKKRDVSAGAACSQAPTNLTALFKERVNESKHINKSLFFLTQVISLKSQGKPDMHIAYRNSPLTKILRSSLGGNSRTCVILCINPCISQLEQTLGTLRFGLNAKKIENTVHANYITTTNDEQLKLLIAQYEKKFQEMQKERELDRNTSANLRKVIEGLQDQKNQLNLRLKNAKENQFTQQSKTNLQKLYRNKSNIIEIKDQIYMENIGILSVLKDIYLQINKGYEFTRK